MSDLVKELQGVGTLVDAQVEAGVSRDEVVDALYRSWIERFGNYTCKLGSAMSAQISLVIKDGPFSKNQSA